MVVVVMAFGACCIFASDAPVTRSRFEITAVTPCGVVVSAGNPGVSPSSDPFSCEEEDDDDDDDDFFVSIFSLHFSHIESMYAPFSCIINSAKLHVL